MKFSAQSPLTLSRCFDEALAYATVIHAGQLRKGTGIPYIAHLLGVTAIALEYGADEREAISALLHDAVEDCGGPERLRDIRTRFGAEVAKIVEDCTDTDEVPKSPWRQRKEKYIAHLKDVDASVRLVCAADKLHNAASILRDLRRHGQAVWSRFKGGEEGTLWYYRALVSELRARGDRTALIDELERVVRSMEEFAFTSERAISTRAAQAVN